MSTLAAIRTNRWGPDEERLAAWLRAAFGASVAVVFHNRPADVVPPLDVVDVNDGWRDGRGLVGVPDWGWRCGDYFYYALREAHPGHDHYWLIEPDVFFSSDPAPFFAAFAAVDTDVLGFGLGPFPQDIRFTRGLPGMAHHRAIFAMTRFSGRALDRLFERRRAMAAGQVSARTYPNDEIFMFTNAVADPELTTGRIEDHAPGWFEGVQFSTDPDLLYQKVVDEVPAGRVLHPVRDIGRFKAALAKRLSSNSGFLLRMRGSLDYLTEADVEEVSALAAAEIRDSILALQTRRQRRLRRERRDG